MNCAYCGTPLPAGALFCVECGRSVADPAPVVRATVRAPLPPAAIELHAPHCPQCGTAIDEGDVFCGECGFVLRPVTAAVPVVAPIKESAGDEPAAEEPAEPPSELEWSEDRVPETAFLGVVEAPASAFAPETASAPAPPAEPATPAEPLPAEPSLAVASDAHPLEDIESTRIVARRAPGERYVLQFSTGESVVVAGTGLIGRNPAPEPGEYVDELVPIFDVGKSVSKSHVEFGQESGRFWVADRFSTNGTVIRQPDAEPVRCEPGKRYMIARGSRVEIGEQFFVVS